jgi:hypothetical protein
MKTAVSLPDELFQAAERVGRLSEKQVKQMLHGIDVILGR